MTTAQRLAIEQFCKNLSNSCDLKDYNYRYYLDNIAYLYGNKQNFNADLECVRWELWNGICNKFRLSKCFQLQLSHIPFINVKDLVNKIIRAIKRRL